MRWSLGRRKGFTRECCGKRDPHETTPLRCDRSLGMTGIVLSASAKATDEPTAAGTVATRHAELFWALSALLWVPQAWLVAHLIAGLLDNGALARSFLPVAGFAALGLLRIWLDARAQRVLTETARAQVSRLRQRILAREAQRSPFDPARPNSAALAAIVTQKLDMLVPYLTRYRPAMARVMVVPLVILAVAWFHSWAVGLVLLVAGPLIPVFQALVGMAAREASARQLQEVGSLNALLLDRLRALADIRLLGATQRALQGFRDRAEALRHRTMAVLRIAFLSSAVLELFAALGVAMVAVYVGFHLLGELRFGTWGAPLTVAEGIFLLMLAPAFFDPLRELGVAWHDKAAAMAVQDEITELDAAPYAPLPGAGTTAVPLAGPVTIQTRGVSVATAERRLSLPDLDIAHGERVALIGPSGSGKSTLLAVLAGLLAPDRGTISLSNVALTGPTVPAWQARVGWLPQGVQFLNASLRANLCLTRPDAPDAEIAAALRLSGAEEIVARLPRGLQTRLGEMGAGVSGGEARRILVARLALSGADVILADEPTADLDEVTAGIVTAGLLALASRGATLVVATHDMRLAARMDRQISLTAASV